MYIFWLYAILPFNFTKNIVEQIYVNLDLFFLGIVRIGAIEMKYQLFIKKRKHYTAVYLLGHFFA